MKFKQLLTLAVSAVLILGLAACAGTAANQENAAGQNATTQNQTGQDDGGSDDPAGAECNSLGELLEQYIGLEYNYTPKTFSDLPNGINGDGCQVFVSGTPEEVGDWPTKNASFVTAMFDAGWEMDSKFSTGLENGQLLTLRQGEFVCMFLSEFRPSDPNLCSPGESLSSCLERIETSDLVNEATISCTFDNYVPEDQSAEPTGEDQDDGVINFADGETITSIDGKLEADSAVEYLLTAAEGQELVVSLSTSPPNQASLEITGADGSILLAGKDAAPFWSGILPSDQDYTVTVQSFDYALGYNLQVILAPQGEAFSDAYRPMDAEACDDLAHLVSLATGQETQTTSALFFDYFTQSASSGCQVTAWGTLDNFPDRTAVSTSINNALAADGWYMVQEYDVEGPGGFGTGYFNGDSLCLYFELVHELDPFACEANDSSIIDCWNGLEQTEMYLEIQMTCATAN